LVITSLLHSILSSVSGPSSRLLIRPLWTCLGVGPLASPSRRPNWLLRSSLPVLSPLTSLAQHRPRLFLLTALSAVRRCRALADAPAPIRSRAATPANAPTLCRSPRHDAEPPPSVRCCAAHSSTASPGHTSTSSSSSHRGQLLRATLGPHSLRARRRGLPTPRLRREGRPAPPGVTDNPASGRDLRPHRAGAAVLPANRTTTPSRTGRRRRRRRCSGTWWPRSSPSSPAPRQSPKPYIFRRFPILVSFWLASITP
jgi:hypothetical protein